MKEQLLIFLVIMITVTVGINAQITFSDDFESYSSGDLLAQSSSDWSTWGGGGAADDAPVSDEFAFSGNNSLKLYSTSANGGPADVILPFGGKHEIGTFTYEMQMYITQSSGGYFNCQAEETPGIQWAFQMYFDPGGQIRVANSSNIVQNSGGSYPYDEWFKVSVDVDLTNNQWMFSVDDNLIVTFENPDNSIATLNLFPAPFDGVSTLFYVDDISFSYEPPTLVNWDASAFDLKMRTTGLTGQTQEIVGTIRNMGINTINSIDITFSDGTNNYTESFSGLDIATYDSYEFIHSDIHTWMEGNNEISITVSNPNGMTDDNDLNDIMEITVTGITPHPDKRVLVEEATGTWCVWCPRGAVFMELMTERYPDHFIGVAVHNSDPMANIEYDAGMTSLPGFSGFPVVAMERASLFNPNVLEQNFFQHVVEAPVARLTNTITDFVDGVLEVTVQAEFLTDVSGDYRLNAIIVENGVTGTSAGYAQANAYSGGGAGEMGGYELLSDPVLASQMVYNEVGRELLGGYDGMEGSLPSVITAGEIHEYTFTYNLADDVNPLNLEVVGVLINPDGTIDNAAKTEADHFMTSISEKFQHDLAITYPNPFSDQLFVQLELENTTNVEMIVFNALGAVVAKRDYGKLVGNQILTFNSANHASGVYYIHIQTGEVLITKKVQLIK